MTTRTKIWKIVSAAVAIIILSSFLLAYARYITLKKALVLRLSDKAGTLVGQKVTIGDLSFGPSAVVNIYDIAVENPEGFTQGRLLKIKRVSLRVNFPELLRGRISLKTVEVAAPELTLIRFNNRLNISDELRAFLSKKVTIEYHIDELKIHSGVFDMNRDHRYHIGDIAVILHPLSSEAATKTSIEASASAPGDSRLSVKGWAYINDDPKRISISALWKDIRLSLFEELAGRSIDGGNKPRKADISLQAEGDTKSGVALKSGMQVKEPRFPFLRSDMKDVLLNVDAFMNLSDDSFIINNAVLKAGDLSTIRLEGTVRDIRGSPSYDAKVRINLPDLSVFEAAWGIKAAGSLTSDYISVKGKFEKTVPLLSGVIQMTNAAVEYEGIRTGSAAARITFNGVTGTPDSLHGSALVRIKDISVIRTSGNRMIVKGAALNADLVFRGRDLVMKSDFSAGKIAAGLSGSVNGFMGEGRSARVKVVLPETVLADIRSSLWDVFPDKLLYAVLNGAVAADFTVEYSKSGMSAEGQFRMKNVGIEGENGEYAAGPVDGTIPLVYTKGKTGEAPPPMPSFERSEFDGLLAYYSGKQPEEGSRKITVGSFRYGFELLDNIEMWIRQEGNYLNVSHFDANIFGSRLDGSAVVDFSGGVSYRAGMLVKGISLTRLCEDITPIKGYISGKVDGLALLKGSGTGMKALIGRADFWSYSSGGEKTKISREFLQKIGGPQMKSYIGERPFDKGIVSLYLQNGFLIFKELEISHKNFIGMTDLSVKVAPFNNRIALDHLMSTIAEAAERAKEK